MKRSLGEKRQRFGFRKMSVGLVSAAVTSLFFVSSVATAPTASAQSINYSYVTEQELTDGEKELIIRDLPGLAQETDVNYYLIYRPATGTTSTPSTSTSQVLPNTGSVETELLVAGGVSLLLLAVRFGKKGKKELAGVILLTATGASFFGPTSSALTSQILARYNHAIEISAGQALPAPAEIDGYVYVGYLKDSKAIEQTTSEEEKTAEFPASEGIRTETIVNKTEAIPFEIQTVENPQLSAGTERVVQEGQDGERIVTIKQVHSKGQIISEEEISSTVTKTAVPKIVEVGTKQATDDIVTEVPDTEPSYENSTNSLTEETVTHTEVFAFDVQEIYDVNLAEGSREVEQKGQDGVRTIETRNYYADGVLIKSEQVSDVVTKEPVTEVVRVGTKTTDVIGSETIVTTEELPFETTVTETEELYVGEEKFITEGKVGSKEVTTTYQTINGVSQPNPTVTEKVLEEPTTKEVLKGTKPIEGTEIETNQVEITFETEYVDDPTLLEGKTKVVTAGVNGSKTVTTTYQTIKGVRQENSTVTEEITKQPVKQVIARGTKVEKVPQVIITDLVENDDAKSATISYKLTDETANFQRAVALLYDNTGALVQEQTITDPNGQLTLENLDFYTDYTVKTKIFYTMAEQEQSSEQEAILESMRKFDLVYKKIEIKDIDAVTVYRRKNGSYIGQEFLEELPASTDELFIKVTSDRFKEVYLPVSSIEETTLNGKAVFKLVSSFDELVQDKDAQYVANREFYIPKMATDANTYTSFKALLDAMKANPSGTFKLGAHLDASEVPVGDVASYVTNFSGTLDGLNDGYAFSISNLKAPLFFNLGGKVQNLDIKNASLNTSSKNPLATIAINANGATITNVAVEASIKGPQNVSGLVHSATNTTIKGVSFKGSIEVTGTNASLTGGILGNGTMASVGNAKVDATITLPGTENQVAGGIVGRTMLVYDVPGSVYNSYAAGSIVTTESAAIVGGIAGANQVTGAYAPHSGNVNNVVSDMTGTKSIIGQPANPTGKIKDGFTTTSDSLTNVTVITDEEAQAKVEAMAIQATIDDSVPLNPNHYSVDYLTLDKAQADHETAYYNMEKILPFYNKELLVYYGNKIATDDKLNKVRLLDVVPMKDNAVVADVYAEKANINKIMLHYADGTVDYKTVSYLEDFKNNHVVEYTISGTDLIYTPESFLNDRSALVNDLVSSLSSVVLDSDAMKAVINYPTTLNADTQTGTAKDFYFGESYDQVMTNNEWFKQTTKAYVVEGKSLIPEVAAKQETTDTYSKYNVGAYSKIVNDTVSNPTWKYNHMLLPLLTLPQENIFIITNMNTIAIGSYEHYVDDYSTVENRDKVRQMVDLAAERQRDNADFWYKILDETNRDKLFRSVLNNEGYVMYGKDGTKSYRNLTADVDAIQDFYGPINKWYREHPSIKTAFADGSETYYITYDMLTDYGTALYTHEMVHNQDGDIYLKGYGRRIGQGMEVYAQGLLQNVFNVTEMNLGFNAVYNSDDANRVHVGDPVARFNSEADFNEYYHNQFDVLYLLDYLEGTNILAQSDANKKAWLRKIENYYVQNNGVDTHAGNSARALTDAEVASLKSFNDLIDQSIIVQRQYVNNPTNTSKKWDRNSYVSVPMFAANFSALSNSNGSPGDIMFRRMAFELIAAKGYTDGFVPYASGQLSDLAMEKGSIIYDTWNKKNTGLITDDHVLEYVFQGQYTSWAEFKKAMFTERLEKAATGQLKPFTMQYELGVADSTKEVTITSFEQLQNLMKEAMEADIQANSLNLNNSRVHALKVKVYQALMNSTNDFRTSIFN
ncbi:ZmpA/ZmpB/ZmpC family metallo-endopeptidase [Streptococcus suis]|nr:ZmpA/ZmpB/ZmpC family metallo-endopeptidase [Streptococcus suis]MDW8602875.1 ZmpA/ZmpB/ZmpC family metallo-endopeptidase [Streptococcus suis]MDW8609031.1 ZmpA/ZmpB/ZmpC family metallo-endopeptidase [Streptococcus suis]MDW8612807.1 ZmpA/ZmpB/ZmpC family metallo-endopeptidase [Streptococcus suis]